MLNIQLDYRADGPSLHVSFPALSQGQEYFLETAQDVQEHYAILWAFWREHCGGQRVHWVINYDNFSVSPKALAPEDELRDAQKLIAETGLSVVCCGGGLLSRSRARWLDGKLQGPLHLCETREEAEAALRQFREPPFSAPAKDARAAPLNL